MPAPLGEFGDGGYGNSTYFKKTIYTFQGSVCAVALSAQPRFYLHYDLVRLQITPDSELCSPPSCQGVDRHKHDRDRDEGRCRQSQGSRLTAARCAAQDCGSGQGPECKFVTACTTHHPTATSRHHTKPRLTLSLVPLPLPLPVPPRLSFGVHAGPAVASPMCWASTGQGGEYCESFNMGHYQTSITD